jgi:hypothetical protein
MRSTTIFSSIACSVLLTITSLVFAGTVATRTMADITMNLSHFPSDSDKQKLAAIINSDDSSESEKAVAAAISKIEHQVSDGDKEKLKSIVGDDATPAELRAVASVLINVMHTPTESDIEKLKEIAAAAGE